MAGHRKLPPLPTGPPTGPPRAPLTSVLPEWPGTPHVEALATPVRGSPHPGHRQHQGPLRAEPEAPTPTQLHRACGSLLGAGGCITKHNSDGTRKLPGAPHTHIHARTHTHTLWSRQGDQGERGTPTPPQLAQNQQGTVLLLQTGWQPRAKGPPFGRCRAAQGQSRCFPEPICPQRAAEGGVRVPHAGANVTLQLPSSLGCVRAASPLSVSCAHTHSHTNTCTHVPSIAWDPDSPLPPSPLHRFEKGFSASVQGKQHTRGKGRNMQNTRQGNHTPHIGLRRWS